MSVEASVAEAPASAVGEVLSTPAPDAGAKTAEPVSHGSPLSDAEKREQAMDATLRDAYTKATKPRASDGKFAAKDADAKPADKTTAATGADHSIPADQPKEAGSEPGKAPAIDAPHSWSAAEKALWASVPPGLQSYISKREADAHAAITRSGEQSKTLEQQVKSYEQIEQLIQGHKDHFVKHGVTPAQSFAFLLQAQRQLEANPVAGLVQLGLQYGIDLRPALNGTQQFTQPQGDPRVAQLEAHIATLNQKIAHTESKVTQRETAERQAQDAEVAKVITDFKDGKDGTKRPYFDEVKEDMAILLKNGRAQDLADAYDRATHANPDIRKRIQEDQRKADEDKRKAAEQARADEARKSNVVNVKSDSATRTNPKSWEDEVEAQGRRLYASG